MAIDLSSEPITETDMHQFCVEMMKRLDIQRRNEHFCDVILEVGSGDDQARLKAHRNVLCAASPFFYNALNSDMKEKKEGVIRLEETSKAVMEEILEYLYTGHVDISEHNVYDLMPMADYFLLSSLKTLCDNVIQEALSPSNCIMGYYFVSQHQWKALEKLIRNFILKNFEVVTKSDDFLNLSIDQVEEWITSDEITVEGEENIFEVIVRWAERDEGRKHQNFPDLFRHIRCVYMARDYLFNVVLPHPLVRENSKCMALVLDAMKVAFDGTQECFFSQSPRNCLKTYEDVIVACGEKKVLCYLPSNKKWRELSFTRNRRLHLHQAVSACHGKLYVIGGHVHSAFGGSYVECYEPLFNTWANAKAPDTIKCTHQLAAVTLQGYLYVIGGRNAFNRPESTVQRYNPDMNLWQEVAPLSSPRFKVCAVADGSYLYAIGGSDASNQFLDTVERFDPRNNIWDKLPSTLAGRSEAGGAAIKQKLFVFGGLPKESTDGEPCEMYDPTTRVWSGIPSLVAPRSFIASAVSLRGQIFVFGTFRNEQGEENKSLQVYDVQQNQWEACTSLSLYPNDFFKISRLRIFKDVLAGSRLISQ